MDNAEKKYKRLWKRTRDAKEKLASFQQSLDEKDIEIKELKTNMILLETKVEELNVPK